jgi:hypothetical protein
LSGPNAKATAPFSTTLRLAASLLPVDSDAKEGIEFTNGNSAAVAIIFKTSRLSWVIGFPSLFMCILEQ